MKSPIPGIAIYNNVINKDLDVINRLSNILSTSKTYTWSDSTVGYGEKIADFRDCFDFKFRKSTLSKDTGAESLELQKIWQEIYDRQSIAVNEYCSTFNVGELNYWEAFNFLKYEKGQHFQYHHDHSENYNCTISLVQYLNDDYEGGELSFGGWGYTYKPVAGDLVIFPSNYMYTHRAMPVTSGTKYALATMLDYSDKYHSAEMHQNKKP